MSWIVLIRPAAEWDLAKVRKWYERKRPGLGGEFLQEFASAMRLLEQAPDRERLYYRNFRRIIFRRFPYKVFYQVIGERVVVFRILHAKQDHERRIGEG